MPIKCSKYLILTPNSHYPYPFKPLDDLMELIDTHGLEMVEDSLVRYKKIIKKGDKE